MTKHLAELEAPFEALAEHLRKVSDGRSIIYIPNMGNFGDGLIRLGTKHFFSHYGFVHEELNIGYSRHRYQLFPLLAKKQRYHFVYGGGGGWSDNYPFGPRICGMIRRGGGALTVLPSTFAVKDMPKGADLFRRDQAQSIEYAPDSRFCHDMALYLAVQKARGKLLSFPAPTKQIGVMMRTDHESYDLSLTNLQGNEDLSLEGDHMSDANEFLRRISEYEEIYTDRLHIAIGACIVGRKVNLYPGNYFKIPAIFEGSLKPHFSDLATLLPTDWDRVIPDREVQTA